MGGQKPPSADPTAQHPQLTVDANGQLSLTGELLQNFSAFKEVPRLEAQAHLGESTEGIVARTTFA